jgi:hypothetical protein
LKKNLVAKYITKKRSGSQLFYYKNDWSSHITDSLLLLQKFQEKKNADPHALKIHSPWHYTARVGYSTSGRLYLGEDKDVRWNKERPIKICYKYHPPQPAG